MTSDELDKSLVFDKAVTQAMSDDLGSDVCLYLTQLFIVELKQTLQSIEQAAEEQNTHDIISHLHILKNSAALYGANRLALLANELHNDALLTPSELIHYTRNLIDIARQTLLQFQSHFTAQDTEGKRDE